MKGDVPFCQRVNKQERKKKSELEKEREKKKREAEREKEREGGREGSRSLSPCPQAFRGWYFPFSPLLPLPPLPPPLLCCHAWFCLFVLICFLQLEHRSSSRKANRIKRQTAHPLSPPLSLSLSLSLFLFVSLSRPRYPPETRQSGHFYGNAMFTRMGEVYYLPFWARKSGRQGVGFFFSLLLFESSQFCTSFFLVCSISPLLCVLLLPLFPSLSLSLSLSETLFLLFPFAAAAHP